MGVAPFLDERVVFAGVRGCETGAVCRRRGRVSWVGGLMDEEEGERGRGGEDLQETATKRNIDVKRSRRNIGITHECLTQGIYAMIPMAKTETVAIDGAVFQCGFL